MNAHTLTQAHAAKRPRTIDLEDHLPAAEWFKCPRHGYSRIIPYATIANHADREYSDWRKTHHLVDHVCTLDRQLDVWIQNIAAQDLANIIAETPEGLGPDDAGTSIDFTPWQRISMAFYVKPRFGVTATVRIETDELRELAEYRQNENRRKLPIQATLSTLPGACRDVGIIDLPTAGGKTAWVLSVSLMLLTGQAFHDIKTEFAHKSAGSIIQGYNPPRIARLAIVAAAGATFEHFVTTARRLVARYATATRIEIWTTTGSTTSTQRAAALPPDTVVFWFVPPAKLSEVLRAHPTITVPVCVVDEYTQDTPRNRFTSDRSTILKMLIAQATPQALQQATTGSRSWLRDYLGGELMGPCNIHTLIRRRKFNDATLAVRQLCMLDLMTVTPFRTRVREDLRSLVPAGLYVRFVPSRRVSISSHIARLQTDLVPPSLSTVILSFLSDIALDDASRTRISELDGTSVTPNQLVTIIHGLTCVPPRYPTSDVLQEQRAALPGRLAERIQEFSQECPICYTAAPTEPRILGCCGYCICSNCFQSLPNNRCAYCRTPIRMVQRSEAPTEATTVLPTETIPLEAERTVRHTQLDNLVHCLHHLRNEGYRRLVIMVERPDGVTTELSFVIDVRAIERTTHIRLVLVNSILNGKGSRFAPVKRDFDSSDPQPMALVCYGQSSRFLVGTDLATTDALIVVGDLDDSILTQTLGRTFRPSPTRDNTRHVPMYRIYSRIGPGRYDPAAPPYVPVN